MAISPLDQKIHSRQTVLDAILRSPGISRTALAASVGLNTATISRISRALIQAGLIVEAENYGPSDRPGRRFVGLNPRSEGGYVIGIAINPFRQTVTLADLNNTKISELDVPEAPAANGTDFLQRCLDKAAQMVGRHVADQRRLFGVGIAVAGEIDSQRGVVQSAPILGWKSSIDAAKMVKDTLGVPLILSTPPIAMNAAEGDIGSGRGIKNLITFNCSLGFGVAVRRHSPVGAAMEMGRVVAESKTPGHGHLPLSHLCGGLAVLRKVFGASKIDATSNSGLGQMLVELIENSDQDPVLQTLFEETGDLAARHLALIVELSLPDRILLVGPMTESADFVQGFRAGLADALSNMAHQPEVLCSAMTPQRASRWLALKGNLTTAVQKLEDLISEDAA